MGKDYPDAPATPDYVGAAQQQGAANLEAAIATAQLSNPNMITPFGNQTVTYNGNIPTVTQTLTPAGQQTVDAQQQVSLGLANLGQQGIGTAQNVLSDPYSYTGPGIQTSFNRGALPVGAGMTGQDAIMSRLEPAYKRREEGLRQQLANQGIAPGTEAFDREMNNLTQAQNDAYTQAATQGLNLDIGVQNQDFGQQQAQAQFGNTAAAQALQQDLTLRNQPLNEISALMSGAQVQLPQFQGYSGANVAAAPVFQGAQAQGQYGMDLYGQQMAAANAKTQGLYSLGGSALGMVGSIYGA